MFHCNFKLIVNLINQRGSLQDLEEAAFTHPGEICETLSFCRIYLK